MKKTDLFDTDGFGEDVRMGKILSHSAIFVDTRDELKRQRFFNVALHSYLGNYDRASFHWLHNYTYYNDSLQGLERFSDHPITFHYTKPGEMHLLDYFIYKIHPFGIEKNITENLPRKLRIDEIIAASDKKVDTPNFRDHVDFHNMTSSEMKET